MPFIMLREFSSISSLLKIFIMKEYWIVYFSFDVFVWLHHVSNADLIE